MSSFEVNFDGLVGPTHNYAGLSFGNVASSAHGGRISSPRQAALQGLQKMKALRDMGLKQGVLPPHERPHLPTLRQLGFVAADEAGSLQSAQEQAPNLLAAASSASCMWVANAGTVSPAPDTQDGRTHFTPANLVSMFHRSIEPPVTGRVLQAIFSGDDYAHHGALPSTAAFGDEGAANHTRFCRDYGEAGVELFVYGVSATDPGAGPKKFPARQTLEASEAVVRSHGLDPKRVVFAQQNPAAIDAGVFHNDVIAVGNRQLLFFHEQAFIDTAGLKAQLDLAAEAAGLDGIEYIEVPTSAVPVQDAVASYLFNSQLVSPPGEAGTVIIVPTECEEIPAVRDYLASLVAAENSVSDVKFFDLKQSMNNGGGPACLRLRVVLSQQQLDSMQARVLLTDSLYERLVNWVNAHYRDELLPSDLADPGLLQESRAALDELTDILGLGAVYDFQRDA